MLKRMIFPIVIGLAGIAILVSLGTWQLQRLTWKEGVLAQIETEIGAQPVAVPVDISPDLKYLPVVARGVIGDGELHVLVSRKQIGAGYRVIAPLTLDDGRSVLLDRGFIPLDAKQAARTGGTQTIIGNLHWPDDMNGSTPAPDLARNIWFGRDIPAMAEALDTAPVLIVARSATGEGIEPLPVGTEGIPNDHLNYAITWFSLALVWFGMTLFLLWRIKTRTA